MTSDMSGDVDIRYAYLKDATGSFCNPYNQGIMTNWATFLGCVKPTAHVPLERKQHTLTWGDSSLW